MKEEKKEKKSFASKRNNANCIGNNDIDNNYISNSNNKFCIWRRWISKYGGACERFVCK